MTDAQPVENAPDAAQDAQPVDGFVHHDEDPEQHIGEELPDPWGDGSNRDWATEDESTKEEVKSE